MAITRVTWTDDSGLGTDGTIINNAALQAIYDSIEGEYGAASVSWTPTIGGSGGQSGQTYSIQVGRQWTTGKRVKVWGRIALSALGTITGDVQIKGLPVAAINVTNAYHTVSIGFFGAMTASFSFLTGHIVPNTSEITLAGVKTPATGTAALAQADLSASTGIIFSAEYEKA